MARPPYAQRWGAQAPRPLWVADEAQNEGNEMGDEPCATCASIQTELDRVTTLLRRAQADRVSQAVHGLEGRQRGLQALIDSHPC